MRTGVGEGTRPGVSHHEVLAELTPLLDNLIGTVAVVGSFVPEELLDAVGRDASVVERFSDLGRAFDREDGPVSVVSYLAMWRPDGAARRLGRLRRQLPSGSRVLFAEPTVGLGTAAVLQRYGRTVAVKRLGLSFHRDIPNDLRQAGFEVTTVLRFSVGFPDRLMTFATGEARSYHAP